MNYNVGFVERDYNNSICNTELFSANKSAEKTINLQCYKLLKDILDQENSSLYLTDESGKNQENLLDVLGEGGSKKAIQIAKGRALILPNMDVDPIHSIAERWERMVQEEVAMSEILYSIGLLAPLSKRVSISFESSEDSIPAYISETFKQLGETKGWFIIDVKNRNSSTWVRGKNFLFSKEEERLNEKNWDSVAQGMIKDVITICKHNIPAKGDSLNIAIVKKPFSAAEDLMNEYEVRCFGFDFSDKYKFLQLPEIKNISSVDRERVKSLISRILDLVFYYEFGNKYAYGEGKKPFVCLKDRLVERYTEQAMQQI